MPDACIVPELIIVAPIPPLTPPSLLKSITDFTLASVPLLLSVPDPVIVPELFRVKFLVPLAPTAADVTLFIV